MTSEQSDETGHAGVVSGFCSSEGAPNCARPKAAGGAASVARMPIKATRHEVRAMERSLFDRATGRKCDDAPMTPIEYPPGTPSWVDLTTSDVDAAAGFYGTLFGWDSVAAG